MKLIFTFLKKHPFLSIHVSLFISAFFSFRYYIERFLFPRTGMGWAYVVDQTVPLSITLLVLFFLLKKKNFKGVLAKLKPYRRLLIFLFTLAFITHLGLLYYYFWSDEPLFVLEPVTQNVGFHFHSVGTANLRGYFLSSYVLTYLLFGTNNLVYQILNLTYFSISVLFVFWFLYLLTNKKIVATLAAAFFATTPAYLDMFTWQNSTHAPILILGLASFIALLYYKKNNRFIYYILSLMFFFSAIKLGFVRSAGFAFVPLLILFLPSLRHRKLLPLLMLTLPYFAIALYFVVFEFRNSELTTATSILENTGSLSKSLNSLFEYRAVTEHPSFFLPKLLFFSAYLFFPSGLVSEMLRFLRPIVSQNTSLVLSLGKLTLLILFSLFLLGFKFRKTREGWLVMFAVLFIFFNMLHFVTGYQASPEDFSPKVPGSFYKLDSRFALENAGYGPGSRYLFISSLGVGLLFALFVSRLIKKGGKRAFIAVLFCFTVVAGNTYFTIRSQVQNFEGMKGYKSLVENIFKIVPRDGKPKLLISANPESNNLDRKFGGWEWIHGFYKKQELAYAANLEEAVELLKKGQYLRENIYAFSNNPQTHTFADVSREARDYFFANSLPTPQAVKFERYKEKSTQLDSDIEGINLLQRPIIESKEVKTRYIAPKELKFRLKIRTLENQLLPMSDSLFTDRTKQFFPSQLWGWVSQPPEIDPNLQSLKEEGESKQRERQTPLSEILQERQALREGARVSVSNTQDAAFVTPESLIDGSYATHLNSGSEEYFLARENPVTITLSFAAPSKVKRILFNTPNNYSLPHSPQKVTVFASLDNRRFYEVVTRENLTSDKWSPNRGVMIRIDLPETIYARSLKFVVTGNSQPIALDEIVVDGIRAAAHTPEDIYNTARYAYHYVDNKEVLRQLIQIKGYNHLILFWSCAEDSDWKKQLNVKEELVPGTWHAAEVNIQPGTGLAEGSAIINCYGSLLRKIFFVGPPYPVEMEVIETVIE